MNEILKKRVLTPVTKEIVVSPHCKKSPTGPVRYLASE